MGNKAGYAETILWTLGLTAGKSAGAYVWAEADDDVRALLRAYPDPALLLQIAEIIRGWKDEEPRALWERLRAERKARIQSGSPADVAGFQVSSTWSYEQGNTRTGFVGPGDRRQDTTATATATATASLANFAMLASSNRLIPGAFSADGRWVNTARDGGPGTLGGASSGGAEFATPAGDVAGAFEIAAHALTGAWAMRSGIPESGYTESRTGTGIGEGHGDSAEAIGARFPRIASCWPPVAVLPRIPSAADLATRLGTPGDLDGVVVYMDPPYSDVPEVVAPTFPALLLPFGGVWTAKLDAALDALGWRSRRQAFHHFGMMLAEVLGSSGAQGQVLDPIVEAVMVLVMDDLVWREWASDVALHDQSVLKDVAAGVADHAVSVDDPSSALPRPADRAFALAFIRGLRRPLALLVEAIARPSSQLREAFRGADEAIVAGLRAIAGNVGTIADLAENIERHVGTLRCVRLDISTRYTRPPRKVTGYLHDLGRADVVRHALDFASMGAHVAISEAVALPELMALGWYASEITGGRKGSQRTFSKQQGEFLTMNRPGAYTVATQLGMFAK